MKFTAKKLRIQKEKSGCCGQGGKTQFKLHVNSCWVGYWSGNKAEALPLAFPFVALSLDVHYPSRTLFSEAVCSPRASSFISNWTLTIIVWEARNTRLETLKCFLCCQAFLYLLHYCFSDVIIIMLFFFKSQNISLPWFSFQLICERLIPVVNALGAKVKQNKSKQKTNGKWSLIGHVLCSRNLNIHRWNYPLNIILKRAFHWD